MTEHRLITFDQWIETTVQLPECTTVFTTVPFGAHLCGGLDGARLIRTVNLHTYVESGLRLELIVDLHSALERLIPKLEISAVFAEPITLERIQRIIVEIFMNCRSSIEVIRKEQRTIQQWKNGKENEKGLHFRFKEIENFSCLNKNKSRKAFEQAFSLGIRGISNFNV